MTKRSRCLIGGQRRGDLRRVRGDQAPADFWITAGTDGVSTAIAVRAASAGRQVPLWVRLSVRLVVSGQIEAAVTGSPPALEWDGSAWAARATTRERIRYIDIPLTARSSWV
ncbi:hypothetical protein [Pseudofrankia sp. BMG5.36]|uniref:hypothetical protein n=1 Tax=Pseudofrankia sp. BMG5.36 TaxID=1834512 RepID=UPI001041E002|nr:hypothetical protein [Pseudofrankia sp. BMG5.36]